MSYLLTALCSYLLGSIPFGYIVGRWHGLDIRNHGSGNIGATNVLRVLGKSYGYPVFFCDVLKGFIPVRLACLLASSLPAHGPYVLPVIAAVCAILGHSFPVWLRFSGGKGVATSAGACLALIPWATLIVTVVWGVIFFALRFVSLASVIAAIALPVSVFLLPRTRDPVLLGFAIAISLLVLLRHRGNIRRLLAGSEPRFRRK
ncbi:MAG: glycerol-3-phosphate 1-O-acyltransferase PlsY [Verrucomicrobiota bacterium]